MNEATSRVVRPEIREQFAAYLAGYAARYPNFSIVGEVMPHWPDRLFGDGFSHLNPDGAAASARLRPLAQRLQAAPPSTQNEAQ